MQSTRDWQNSIYRTGTSDNVSKDEVISVQKSGLTIKLRRIAFWDGQKNKTYEFISNNFLLGPGKICDIYWHRWQIETMFKPLKQSSPLKYFLGDSQKAIEIQIWCGLIIHILMLVIQKRAKRRWAYSNMISLVRLHLMSYIDLFSFMENPTQKWDFLITGPPDRQLSMS